MNRAFQIALMMSLISMNGYASKPIENLIDILVPAYADGTDPTLEDTQRAIIQGCNKRGWTPSLEDKNKNIITAAIVVRSKHYAKIEIPFSAKKYSIIYKSSKNLDYNEEKQLIHRNYNRWVNMLRISIQNEFTEVSQEK